MENLIMTGHIVKEIKLGATKINFCDDYIAKTKEERIARIINFKQCVYKILYSK